MGLAGPVAVAYGRVGVGSGPAEADNGVAAEVRDQEAHRPGTDRFRQLLRDHLDRCGGSGRLNLLQQRSEIGVWPLIS
jgi:hypothetical protein